MRHAPAFCLLFCLVATPALSQQPEGSQPYLGMKDQFVITLPSGWTVFDQGEVLMGKKGKTGPTVIFTSEPIDARAMLAGDRQAAEKVAAQFGRIEVGLIPSFLLDRLRARSGISCKGFERDAQEGLLALMLTDPMFGRGRTVREKPQAEPVPIGGCQGLRVKGKGTTSNGAGKVLDVFAVSDGDVLFLFKTLNLEEHYAKNLATFEAAMSTLKLTGAVEAASPPKQ